MLYFTATVLLLPLSQHSVRSELSSHNSLQPSVT